MTSPYDPARRALVEPIQQPIYSSNTLTAAAPETRISFFPIPAASLSNPVRTNLSDNKLANPKIFVIRGVRLHIDQTATLVDATGVQTIGAVQIVENYWYRLFIGVKEYLRVPGFWMSSGVGIYLMATGAPTAATNVLYTQGLGVPSRENYFKLNRKPIVIPPQQEFETDFNLGPQGLASFSGSNRRLWNFLEGELGREVM